MPNNMNWEKEFDKGFPYWMSEICANSKGQNEYQPKEDRTEHIKSFITQELTENRNATVRECVEALPAMRYTHVYDLKVLAEVYGYNEYEYEARTALLALIDKKV